MTAAQDPLPDPGAPELLPNLPAALSWRPVVLLTGDDNSEGMLVFWKERLIAVLSRVEFDRLGREAMWHLEVGFGDCAAPPAGAVFQSLAQGLRWLAQCMEVFGG